jgi:hypothetical protein
MGRLTLLTLLVAFAAMAQPAQAYIDPGTGSNLLSSLGIMLGVICTGAAMCSSLVRQWASAILAKVRSHRPAGESPDEPSE